MGNQITALQASEARITRDLPAGDGERGPEAGLQEAGGARPNQPRWTYINANLRFFKGRK